ncbi:hypothetical protein J2S71_001038 [Olsenella profusa DSM 13989]|nr:hypothetical protein [Olsenella profusa DSM 13989]
MGLGDGPTRSTDGAASASFMPAQVGPNMNFVRCGADTSIICMLGMT